MPQSYKWFIWFFSNKLFQDAEENSENVVQSENSEDSATTESQNIDEKKTDIFLLTDEEEENNDSNNISSFYTEPLVIESWSLSFLDFENFNELRLECIHYCCLPCLGISMNFMTFAEKRMR